MLRRNTFLPLSSLSPPRRIRREPLSQYLFITLRISAVNFLCDLCGYFFLRNISK
jgi:hypothetical protein